MCDRSNKTRKAFETEQPVAGKVNILVVIVREHGHRGGRRFGVVQHREGCKSTQRGNTTTILTRNTGTSFLMFPTKRGGHV